MSEREDMVFFGRWCSVCLTWFVTRQSCEHRQAVNLYYRTQVNGGEDVGDGALQRAIAGALRSAIDAHGPIDALRIGSAAKRIIGALANVNNWAL